MLVKIVDSNGNRYIQRGVEMENWERASSNKPLQGIALTECLPSAFVLDCFLFCLPAHFLCLPSRPCSPTCLPGHLSAHMPACLPTYLLAGVLACLLPCLLAYMLACMHACLLA